METLTIIVGAMETNDDGGWGEGRENQAQTGEPIGTRISRRSIVELAVKENDGANSGGRFFGYIWLYILLVLLSWYRDVHDEVKRSFLSDLPWQCVQ